MTLRTSRTLLVALGAGQSASAFAHVGDHGETGLMDALRHMFTEPTHIGMMLAAIGAGVALVIYARGRAARREESLKKLRTIQ